MARQFVDDGLVTLKFGGGVHSRASEDEIDNRECKSGKNFRLDLQNMEFRNRPPFDLVGTAPNAGSINGFISLLKSDGTVSFCVQAAGTVYELDTNYNFSSIGSVSSSAQLRGRIEHNWQLADEVLITDLALAQPVMKWDGTTLANVSFTDEDGAAFGIFNAKYCFVSGERAVFANVKSNGTTTNHILVGSEQGDYTKITVANKPSSALAETDSYFIIQPDYRPINGLVESFDQIITSSFKGSLFKLTGSSASNFQFEQLYPQSGASGAESLVYVGNDVHYGRQGRIESVSRSDLYKDVETDDLSIDIQDLIVGYDNWTIVYNSRTQIEYCFPQNQSECWALYKPLLGSQIGADGARLSPWIQYTTQHAMAFQPTAVMNAYDPADGLEYIFMGDAAGNVYRMEGTGTGDGGTADIQTERLSKLISSPADGSVYEVEGYVKHRKNEAATLTLRFEYAGEAIFNESITVSLPVATGATYYSNASYYSNGNYYGTPFKGKLRREKFGVAGSSNEFQIRATVEGTSTFEINEIGLRFKVSSP